MAGSKTLIFHPRNLVVFAALVLLLVLRWKFGLPVWAFAVFFVLPLIIYYVGLPMLARRRFPEFERRVRMLLQKGRGEAALACYRRGLFMRLFGPVVELKRLQGQVNAMLGRWSSAHDAFSRALSAGGSLASADLAILVGYAEACFHTGDDREAERVLAGINLRQLHLAPAVYYRAHLMIEDDKQKGRARQELEGFPWDPDKERGIRLLLEAELLAEAHQLDPAAKALAQVKIDELPLPLRPMAGLLAGKLLFMRGRRQEALKRFGEIEKRFPAGRHLVEIEDFEEALRAKTSEKSEANHERQ